MPATSAPAVHEDETAPSPSTVGNTFMRQYYHFLVKEPQSLHRFYKAESRWCHGVGSHMEEPIAGQRSINDQILKRGYAGARVDLDAGSIDCQNSQGGGVLVLVTGVMTLRGDPTPKPFVQTFFLAVQPKGYFVLNDCLRFLELPGASPIEVAPEVKDKENGKPETPMSPVKEETPVPASPKKAASPVKTVKTTTTKVVKEAAPVSPVKATATVASSPVKKTTTTTTTTTTTKEVEAPAVKTPSPVKSPVKSPEKSPKKQDKTPTPAASPAPAPADPVVAAPAEPEKPKTWAALFSGPKTASITPSAPISAPVKPSTPKAAPAPAPASITPATNAPAPEKSPKNKAGNGKEKEHKRLYSLFIRDVPAQTRENDLRELFKGYGSIAGVSVVAQRGFAFVDYYEQESMRSALAETKEFKVFDKVLQVDERAERKEGQRGSFRGNDARGRGRGHGPKAGRGERKERNGDEAPSSNKGERREAPRREKTGNRRGGKVDATSLNRVE
ncbi:hypothetical protein PC115_g11106 [Phytophthora cactorum]|uniref:Uncharacterized protein n=1 Tax=Phytophthora cactorum TaxID=29920 RepID=A0A8T1C5L0_9STRA|nr:hypothetical protein PC115_g11106 [Phytophthora cactorum]